MLQGLTRFDLCGVKVGVGTGMGWNLVGLGLLGVFLWCGVEVGTGMGWNEVGKGVGALG